MPSLPTFQVPRIYFTKAFSSAVYTAFIPRDLFAYFLPIHLFHIYCF